MQNYPHFWNTAVWGYTLSCISFSHSKSSLENRDCYHFLIAGFLWTFLRHRGYYVWNATSNNYQFLPEKLEPKDGFLHSGILLQEVYTNAESTTLSNILGIVNTLCRKNAPEDLRNSGNSMKTMTWWIRCALSKSIIASEGSYATFTLIARFCKDCCPNVRIYVRKLYFISFTVLFMIKYSLKST